MPRRIGVTPVGEYAGIDLTDQHALLDALDDPGRQAQAISRVLADPGGSCPPVLMTVAALLFAAGNHELGASWFYTAQLRARGDANRCTDPTAAAACDVLTATYGPPINRWTFREHPELVLGFAERAVAWDAATPRTYDHRWIALHGLAAFGHDPGPVSIPDEAWPAAARRTREEFLAGARELFDDDGRLRTELFDDPDA